ncbi:MAG: hypothetical protein IPM42_11775 [Saprospiraceae bacterium]|nr:hypothetical protein [Saprospiraceae bacterium]
MDIIFKDEYDIYSINKLIIDNRDFEEIVKFLSKTKKVNKRKYFEFIEKMKVIFAMSDDYEFLSTASLIFNEFKVHSAVPFIVAKLLKGDFDSCGGTFLYSLISLNLRHLKSELEILWERDITWEMEQKLMLLGIKPKDSRSA